MCVCVWGGGEGGGEGGGGGGAEMGEDGVEPPTKFSKRVTI